MLWGRYQFHCRFINRADLPYFKGSTFRGVFGQALKNVVCALKRQECSACLLRQKCLYVNVFETSLTGEPVQGARVAAPPHPFVIEPPLETTTRFREGDSFDFNLLLFGETNHNLPYFVYAFDQMGKIGLGRKVDGRRGHFSLEEVRVADRLIYSAGTQTLATDGTCDKLLLDNTTPVREDSFRLRVRLLTPLRFKFENRLQAALPFHVLVRNMLRRASTLLLHYGDGEPDLDYRGLVARAREVRIEEQRLDWFDWRRYSFRQDQAMLMGGLTGSIVYEGKIGEFMPLLDFCSRVHLGKQTTFGLGLIEAERV